VPRGVYWEIVDGLEKKLVEHDYIPTFLHLRRAEERVEQMLGDGRFDGCISLGLIAPTVLNMLRRHKVPSVLINSGADATWSRVNPNDDQGGGEAMAHLLRQGHRRILYYAGEAILDHPSAVLREGAYRRCMREAIHCARRRYAAGDGSGPAEVLDGRQQARLDDAEDRAHAAKNLTRSPARNRQGGSESGRNSLTDVRPIRCQPPGVGSG